MESTVLDEAPAAQASAPVVPAAPTEPGTPFGGGFYVGRLRIGAELFALIVSPKAEGDATGVTWGKRGQDVPAARSCFDGLANTQAMAEAGSALAQTVLQLDIAGFTDWYLPSRDEVELLYRHLKPTAVENYESFRDGDNPSSVPAGYPYTAQEPGQTAVEAFRKGGAEALEPTWYWASTQYSAYDAWGQYFSDGYQYGASKVNAGRARAVRRFKLNP
jgi:hypothetical protein